MSESSLGVKLVALGAAAGVAASAVGLWLFADYKHAQGAQRRRARARARARFLHNQRHAFSSRKEAVLAFATSGELECLLSEEEVWTVYGAMAAMVERPEEGRISMEAFVGMLKEAGLHSDSLARSAYRVWDVNHNGAVSFDEVLRGLGILLHGTGRQRLDWHFDAYDVDRSGYLDREEISNVYRALVPEAPEEEVRARVWRVMRTVDEDHDSVVTREEFCSLAEHLELVSGIEGSAGPSAAVTRELLSQFGLGRTEV